ncbi:MAG: hypothetical protein JNN05_03725, partial [Candidatus Omnitrophica bacterium]|nr:hypothetical protein [Candidatus Omnitrophota bacterium]
MAKGVKHPLTLSLQVNPEQKTIVLSDIYKNPAINEVKMVGELQSILSSNFKGYDLVIPNNVQPHLASQVSRRFGEVEIEGIVGGTPKLANAARNRELALGEVLPTTKPKNLIEARMLPFRNGVYSIDFRVRNIQPANAGTSRDSAMLSDNALEIINDKAKAYFTDISNSGRVIKGTTTVAGQGIKQEISGAVQSGDLKWKPLAQLSGNNQVKRADIVQNLTTGNIYSISNVVLTGADNQNQPIGEIRLREIGGAVAGEQTLLSREKVNINEWARLEVASAAQPLKQISNDSINRAMPRADQAILSGQDVRSEAEKRVGNLTGLLKDLAKSTEELKQRISNGNPQSEIDEQTNEVKNRTLAVLREVPAVEEPGETPDKFVLGTLNHNLKNKLTPATQMSLFLGMAKDKEGKIKEIEGVEKGISYSGEVLKTLLNFTSSEVNEADIDRNNRQPIIKIEKFMESRAADQAMLSSIDSAPIMFNLFRDTLAQVRAKDRSDVIRGEFNGRDDMTIMLVGAETEELPLSLKKEMPKANIIVVNPGFEAENKNDGQQKPYQVIRRPIQEIKPNTTIDGVEVKEAQMIFSSGLFNNEYKGEIQGTNNDIYGQMVGSMKSLLSSDGKIFITTGEQSNPELENSFKESGLKVSNLTEAANLSSIKGMYVAQKPSADQAMQASDDSKRVNQVRQIAQQITVKVNPSISDAQKTAKKLDELYRTNGSPQEIKKYENQLQAQASQALSLTGEFLGAQKEMSPEWLVGKTADNSIRNNITLLGVLPNANNSQKPELIGQVMRDLNAAATTLNTLPKIQQIVLDDNEGRHSTINVEKSLQAPTRSSDQAMLSSTAPSNFASKTYQEFGSFFADHGIEAVKTDSDQARKFTVIAPKASNRIPISEKSVLDENGQPMMLEGKPVVLKQYISSRNAYLSLEIKGAGKNGGDTPVAALSHDLVFKNNAQGQATELEGAIIRSRLTSEKFRQQGLSKILIKEAVKLYGSLYTGLDSLSVKNGEPLYTHSPLAISSTNGMMADPELKFIPVVSAGTTREFQNYKIVLNQKVSDQAMLSKVDGLTRDNLSVAQEQIARSVNTDRKIYLLESNPAKPSEVVARRIETANGPIRVANENPVTGDTLKQMVLSSKADFVGNSAAVNALSAQDAEIRSFVQGISIQEKNAPQKAQYAVVANTTGATTGDKFARPHTTTDSPMAAPAVAPAVISDRRREIQAAPNATKGFDWVKSLPNDKERVRAMVGAYKQYFNAADLTAKQNAAQEILDLSTAMRDVPLSYNAGLIVNDFANKGLILQINPNEDVSELKSLIERVDGALAKADAAGSNEISHDVSLIPNKKADDERNALMAEHQSLFNQAFASMALRPDAGEVNVNKDINQVNPRPFKDSAMLSETPENNPGAYVVGYSLPETTQQINVEKAATAPMEIRSSAVGLTAGMPSSVIAGNQQGSAKATATSTDRTFVTAQNPGAFLSGGSVPTAMMESKDGRTAGMGKDTGAFLSGGSVPTTMVQDTGAFLNGGSAVVNANVPTRTIGALRESSASNESLIQLPSGKDVEFVSSDNLTNMAAESAKTGALLLELTDNGLNVVSVNGNNEAIRQPIAQNAAMELLRQKGAKVIVPKTAKMADFGNDFRKALKDFFFGKGKETAKSEEVVADRFKVMGSSQKELSFTPGAPAQGADEYSVKALNVTVNKALSANPVELVLISAKEESQLAQSSKVPLIRYKSGEFFNASTGWALAPTEMADLISQGAKIYRVVSDELRSATRTRSTEQTEKLAYLGENLLNAFVKFLTGKPAGSETAAADEVAPVMPSVSVSAVTGDVPVQSPNRALDISPADIRSGSNFRDKTRETLTVVQKPEDRSLSSG